MSPVPEKGCMGKQHACLPWQMTKTLDSPKTSSRQLKTKNKTKTKTKTQQQQTKQPDKQKVNNK